MRAKLIQTVTIGVLLVAVTAIGMGLSTPDGTVRRAEKTPSATAPTAASSPSPSPTPSPTPTPEPGSLSPITGVWPGRPAETVENAGVVDWCPAVQVTISSAALRQVGEQAARQAACNAVAFTFDVRYSRLSLPHQGYAESDFAPVVERLSDRARAHTYPARIRAVMASPTDRAAREGTGVVLLTGPQPGNGRRYFGPPWSDAGYADRPAWVDPVWTTVTVDLRRGGSRPLLQTSFEASAGLPVWNPGTQKTEKLTVATTATYVLAAPDWRVDGWTLATEARGFTPLG
ncbi:MAG: hypothetical protein QM597_01685 [Aeromicrobium sp.]|uniref:hypothetical protein n=1 Tax=Aeromicrobium sp. TaxID=1871063 RepID=UPI0039E6DD90